MIFAQKRRDAEKTFKSQFSASLRLCARTEKKQLNYNDHIRNHLQQSAELKQHMAAEGVAPIAAAAEMLAQAFKAGNKFLLCGNGGSAADCQHLAAEFVSRLTKDFERPGLPAIALTTDTSFLTAYGNDYGFAGVFQRQVQALGAAEDVLLGISTSGNSENIIAAVNTARDKHIRTITLTGNNGGRLAALSDVAIIVPGESTQYIQETHLAIEHILCEIVEQILFA